METLPSVMTLRRSCGLYTMRTCLSSFFCSENTPTSNQYYLIKSIIIYELSSHTEKASTLQIPARRLEPSRASSPFPPFGDVDSL